MFRLLLGSNVCFSKYFNRVDSEWSHVVHIPKIPLEPHC